MQKIPKKNTLFIKILLLKSLIHGLSLYYAIQLFYLGIIDQLGADPVKAVIHSTGISGLNLLLLTLLVSPLARHLQIPWLMRVRRLLGIYAFVYALLHLFSYAAFDLQFDLALLASEIVQRPYISLGMIALMLLIPLAITSLHYFQRKLGSRWQTLHNAIYLVTPLVVIHYYWSVKSDTLQPIIYGVILCLLLIWRWKKLYRYISKKNYN